MRVSLYNIFNLKIKQNMPEKNSLLNEKIEKVNEKY
jgi:hypothetical protein